MKKILISDKLNPKCVELFQNEGHKVDFKPGISKEELLEIIPEYNALLVRSATKVTAEVINAGENLEIIGRAGTGVDNIDLSAATRKGIIVMNTPGGNTRSAAEHTIAMMMSLCRHIPQANISLREGKWERKLFSGTEVDGKTLGVIGLGKIGREVALMARGLGMNIIGYDPILSPELADELNIQLLTLDEIYKSADFISVHVPLTDSTKGLISRDEINKCKDGVKFINCARGGIIDEEALLEGLDSGKVSGAAIDVFTTEPPENRRLVEHPKVVATPHLGASTEEAQKKVAIQLAEQMIEFFNGGELRGPVNAVAVKYLNNESVQPLIQLASKIGSFQSQILSSNIKNINIVYNNSKFESFEELIEAAFIVGLLSEISSDPVNYLNAKITAEERGIDVSVNFVKSSSKMKDYFLFETETKEKTISIAGSIFNDTDPRIVKIDGFNLELQLKGNFIIYENIDKPGVLASVSNLLAKDSINIAGLSLGRNTIGGEATTIIEVDSEVPDRTIELMKQIDEIKSVYKIKL